MPYYDYHQDIAYTNVSSFLVRIGGLQFTNDFHQVHGNFFSSRKILESYT